jgi:predicted transcriptional regulator
LEHVAHEADVSLRHYQKIGNGEIDMRLTTLFNIAAALRVRPQRLLERTDTAHDARR